MSTEEILNRLNAANHIYGYMYGVANPDHKVIGISTKDVRLIGCDHMGKTEFGLYFRFGFPGPDVNIYAFSDYGRTWAFTREELQNEGGG